MKIPVYLGRSLSCLGALSLALLPAVPSSASTSPLPMLRSTLSIQHRETCSRPESMASPLVTEVRQTIAKGYLQVGSDRPAAFVVGQSLRERYGPRLHGSEEEMGYAWMWNPVLERWELVCMSSATFVVDFADRGSVVVQTKDDMVLR